MQLCDKFFAVGKGGLAKNPLAIEFEVHEIQ